MLPARDHRLEAAAGAAAAAAGGEGTELSAPGDRSPRSNASARNAVSAAGAQTQARGPKRPRAQPCRRGLAALLLRRSGDSRKPPVSSFGARNSIISRCPTAPSPVRNCSFHPSLPLPTFVLPSSVSAPWVSSKVSEDNCLP